MSPINDAIEREVEDHAAAAREHPAHSRARTEKHSFNVDRIDAVEVLFRSVLDGADVRDAGVVHQYVDAGRVAVGIDAREGGFHRVSECDVTFERRRGAASRANALDGVASRFEIAIEREDMRAVARERR